MNKQIDGFYRNIYYYHTDYYSKQGWEWNVAGVIETWKNNIPYPNTYPKLLQKLLKVIKII